MLLEILDHIFSFLVPHRETLIACSKDPVLSHIVEKYLYHHLIINIGDQKTPPHSLTPDQLSKLVLENPRILYHVRILQIQFGIEHLWVEGTEAVMAQHLDEFANLLLMFPVLECIMLISLNDSRWDLPDAFRAALEDRLNLPTITEAHIEDVKGFSLSLFDNCASLKKLTLVGSFRRCDTTSAQPQLQSLTVDIGLASMPPLYMAWIKLHIKELQSLKCEIASVRQERPLPEFLGVCSQTLTKLDIFISEFTSVIDLSADFSPFPSNLRQLKIRTAVAQSYDSGFCFSFLPSAAKAIKLFISSLQHLVIDVNVRVAEVVDLANVNFSPLAVLGAASLSIPRIDLYAHTGKLPAEVIHARLLSSLEKCEDAARAIKEGVLVIHPEETAPDFV